MKYHKTIFLNIDLDINRLRRFTPRNDRQEGILTDWFILRSKML